MDNVKVRCRSCGKELEGHHSRTISCGCANMTAIRGDRIFAKDLSNVVMLQSPKHNKDSGLTSQDLQWQEDRRKRKVRKLDFEVR